jgi:hypothetical protein
MVRLAGEARAFWTPRPLGRLTDPRTPPHTRDIEPGLTFAQPADGLAVYGPVGFSPFGIDGGYDYGKVTYTF